MWLVTFVGPVKTPFGSDNGELSVWYPSRKLSLSSAMSPGSWIFSTSCCLPAASLLTWFPLSPQLKNRVTQISVVAWIKSWSLMKNRICMAGRWREWVCWLHARRRLVFYFAAKLSLGCKSESSLRQAETGPSWEGREVDACAQSLRRLMIFNLARRQMDNLRRVLLGGFAPHTCLKRIRALLMA